MEHAIKKLLQEETLISLEITRVMQSKLESTGDLIENKKQVDKDVAAITLKLHQTQQAIGWLREIENSGMQILKTA
ncbi:MAG: hypothetical protein ACPG5O_04055 [Pseudoalteromonas tetraodonis]